MSLFHTHPYFQNDHTDEPTALGLAIFPLPDTLKYDVCYYLSATGPPAALRSIWASLVKNRGASLYCDHWRPQRPFLGMAPIKNAIRGYKRTNAGHLAAFTRQPELILLTHTTAATLIHPADQPQRDQLQAENMPIAFARLEAWLQESSTVPVRLGWGEILWPYLTNPVLSQLPAKAEGTALTNQESTVPLTPLLAYGDCLAAWLINASFPWRDFVCSLITQKVLSF